MSLDFPTFIVRIPLWQLGPARQLPLVLRVRSEWIGAVAEWLRSGLQSREHRFDSGPRLQALIRLSSVGRTVDC